MGCNEILCVSTSIHHEIHHIQKLLLLHILSKWDRNGSVAQAMGLSSACKISVCPPEYYAFFEIFRQLASSDERRACFSAVAAEIFATTTQSIPLSKFLFNLKDSLICLFIRFLTTAFLETLRETAIPSLAVPGLLIQKITRKNFP